MNKIAWSCQGMRASEKMEQILVKTMIRKRSFGNPFEGSRREERSLSAPGNLLAKRGSEDSLQGPDPAHMGEEEVLL